MSSQLFNLSADSTAHVVTGIAAAIVAFTMLSQPSKLDGIPTVGSSGWLGSWWDSFKCLTNTPGIVQEGYEKYNSAPFKIATLSRWIVILSSPEHVEELQRAPGDTISSADAIDDVLQPEYTMGTEIQRNPYHISIVRIQLTRNLKVLFPEIRDEIVASFDDVLDLEGNEWKTVVALDSIQQIVCRTSNRVFVGLPLCRDPDWTKLNIRFALNVFWGAFIIGLFPKFLKPIVTRLSTRIHQSNQWGRKLLGPIVEERRELDEHANKWENKPNDFLAWLMEEEGGSESTVESLTTRMLVLNFAAIYTSSASFIHALFSLAANPEYIQPLREEVDGIVGRDGWSKASVAKMHKVDSFLKECLRMEGMTSATVERKAMKDFTFSDGTFIPRGTRISVPTRCLHYTEKYYKDANEFKPFRFSDMHGYGKEGGKDQLVLATSEYLTFGIGDHACPGRFFASIMMKAMLAHIVAMYDIKLKDGATAPRSLYFNTLVISNPREKIQFRRRVD